MRKKLGKKLTFKTEVIRNLVDHELEMANGGIAASNQWERCSTGSIDKCYTANTMTKDC